MDGPLVGGHDARRGVLIDERMGDHAACAGLAVGDAVEIGDEIVLEESMKMEIPVLTEAAGRVVEVKVEPGDVVQEGEILAVIETGSG